MAESYAYPQDEEDLSQTEETSQTSSREIYSVAVREEYDLLGNLGINENLAYFLLGVGVGVALSLLLAPRTNPETTTSPSVIGSSAYGGLTEVASVGGGGSVDYYQRGSAGGGVSTDYSNREETGGAPTAAIPGDLAGGIGTEDSD
jgi:hypothetical protein